MKKLGIILLTVILLASCGEEEKYDLKDGMPPMPVEGVNSNDIGENNVAPVVNESNGIKKRNDSLKDRLSEEEANLVSEYETAKESNDFEKLEESLEKINKLIEMKENNIEKLNEEGNVEEALKINRELRSLEIIIR